jgi:hypothetical protein
MTGHQMNYLLIYNSNVTVLDPIRDVPMLVIAAWGKGDGPKHASRAYDRGRRGDSRRAR